jgi:hypothetical protein
MTMDDLMQTILAIAPDALFDEEYGSGEIMVSTGFKLQDGNLVPLVDMSVSGE